MIQFLQEIYHEHKVLCILIPICVIVGIISISVSPSGNLENGKKPYVYTKDQFLFQDEIESYLPYVNLKGSDAKEFNQELEEIYQDQEHTLLTYSYDISGDFLSVVYCIIDISGELPEYEMHTKVFDIPSKKLVTTDQLLDFYNVTEEDVRTEIEANMHSYYNEMVDKQLIEVQECDYNCFLEDRYFDGDKELELAISEGDLYAYQGFRIYGIYGESEYFKQDHFKFFVANYKK